MKNLVYVLGICFFFLNNTVLIAQETKIVCVGERIPDGWEVIQDLRISSNLCNNPSAAYKIKKLVQDEFICRGFNIPKGWVLIAEQKFSNQCEYGTNRIVKPIVRTNVCDGSGIPDGWVVTKQENINIQCEGGGFVIEKAKQRMIICIGTKIPPKYKIIATNSHSQACDYGTHTIEMSDDDYDGDGDGSPKSRDCDDNNANRYPGAREIPNNTIDENCDGKILIIDRDKDGVNSDDDYDDNNPYVGVKKDREYPSNGLDDDANGLVDEVNADGDKFWTYAHCTLKNNCPPQDCNDNNPYAGIKRLQEKPGNRIDDDCDGLVDEADEDGDGFLVFWKCLNNNCPPKQDCNDNDRLVYPGAPERPNNRIDDDCDGLVDEADKDRDGFITYYACNLGSNCPDLADKDCDDNNSSVYPDAKEIVNNGIDENCSGKDNIVIWQMFTGGKGEKKVLNRMERLSRLTNNLLVGDFDGDGNDDIFRANGKNWTLFKSGGDETEKLEMEVSLKINSLKVGDFDGDGKTDLLNATGSKWRVAYGGKKPWVTLKENTTELDKLHIGDFDGDGKDDIAVISTQQVKYASGGTGEFISSRGETFKRYGFLIGDFDGDGKEDIFNGNGEEWRVMYGATGEWVVLKRQTSITDELSIGYYTPADADGNRDKNADIFKATGKEWRVWHGGKGAFHVQKTTSETDILFGDFDGNGITDVFRIRTLGE